LDGWIGRLKIGSDVSDLVVLRQPDSDDLQPPVASYDRLLEAVQRASDLKSRAVTAVYEGRRRSLPSSGLLKGWTVVEIMVDRAMRVWVGVYEAGSGPDSNWMVEFDDGWSPCGVSVKGSLDKRNIGETGRRLA
jgi:hypothetical protein